MSMSDQPIHRSTANVPPVDSVTFKFLNAAGTGFPTSHTVPRGTTVETFLASPGILSGSSFREYIIALRPVAGATVTPDANRPLANGDFLTCTYQGQKGA